MEKDYKKTLLMFDSGFEMRGNLNAKEPGIIQEWDDKKIYEKLLEKNKNGKSFVLHDGPPYANGNLHVGHALNKILKDIVIKSKAQQGYKTPFVPGWDTHGLPIETAITKTGVDRKTMSSLEFRKLCEKYALEQVEIQKAQFKRLGVIGDWNNPYITLQKEFESKQLEVFFKMFNRGMIFKGLKPVYWSPSSESALAEAEIEYHEKTSPSIYVAFKVTEGKGKLSAGDEVVIWTTTPWTMPANRAVALGAEIDYSLVKVQDRKFLIATDLVKSFTEACGYEEFSIEWTANGEELEGAKYAQPLSGEPCPVVIGHHVTTDGGTGIVHIAPGHGEDDFMIGKKYGLEVFSAVDGEGKMTAGCGQFAGTFYEDANKEIGMKLTELGSLLKLKFIKHQYPHDWRTKKPVIFRATPQWFASVDKIKTEILDEIKNVNWIPGWGEQRLFNMMVDRQDWCISRQRVWGVPIPMIYCENGEPVTDNEVFENIVKLVKENGTNVWFEKSAVELLPVGYKNVNSPNGKFTKESDIMDVWFDSGSTHTAVCEARGMGYPADLYLEGSDQYRGWFNSSLITGVAANGKAPYKSVLTHGFVLDGKGQKMSKSLGNVIDPLQVSTKFGADILRLWVSSINYQSDVRISDEIIMQNAEFYKKIRNTMKFITSAIVDFDINKNKAQELKSVDYYMLSLANDVIKNVNKAYDEYDFGKVFTELVNFMNTDLSAFYFDMIKDIIYTAGQDSLRRRQVQTTLHMITDVLIKMLMPIIPHTMEEAYRYFNKDGKYESVLLEDAATTFAIPNEAKIREDFAKFMIVRDDFLKAMENARKDGVVTKASETHAIIDAPADYKEILESDGKEILCVSKLTIANNDGQTFEVAKVKIEKAEGAVCERCRIVFEAKDMTQDGICVNCAKTIQ